MKKLIFAALAVALVMTGCKKPATLGSYTWELYEVVSTDATGATINTETPPMGITLMFDETQKTISGHSVCNNYLTSYETGADDTNTIKFGMPVATKKACPDMEFESRYFGWLAGAGSYEVSHEELKLKISGTEFILVYKPEFK